MASFEETASRFSETIVAGPSVTGLSELSGFKVFMISLSGVSVLIVASLLLFFNNDSTKTEVISVVEAPPEKKEILIVEVPEKPETTSIIQSQPLPKVDAKEEEKVRPVENKPDQPLPQVEEITLLPSSPLKNLKTTPRPTEKMHFDSSEVFFSVPEAVKEVPVLFTINEKTPTGQLASISGQARQAGIDFIYNWTETS